MAGFTDIHHHIAYGLDDGARRFEDAARMLRAAHKDGISTIIATPHVEPGRRAFDMAAYYERLDELNAYCMAREMPIGIFPGCEIMYTDETLRFLQSGRIPTLAGGRFVLVEFMPDVTYERLFEAVRKLANAGYRPVVAHIERYGCLVRNEAHIRELRELLRVRLQVNCTTVVEAKGRMRRFVQNVLEKRLIDFVATDAHNVETRPVRMKACYRVIKEGYGAELAGALVKRNQAEIFLE